MCSIPRVFPFIELPKAELHLHLEGSVQPEVVVELAARHGEKVSLEEATARYSCADFDGFIQAFIWVTSFLREPEDYSFIMRRLADELIRQKVVYAEVSISAGVMAWRNQSIAENLAAIGEAALEFRFRGLRTAFILDCVRQFGPEPAMEVAKAAANLRELGVVAFGLGGKENSVPSAEFRGVFEFARVEGLHSVPHAGEFGDAGSVRESIEILGAERIAHGIAAMHDAALCSEIIDRHVTLDICPTSNVVTGALAHQIQIKHATLADHPIRTLFDRGICITLSTDDPPMFHTSLDQEYAALASLGFASTELCTIVENGFRASFLPAPEKQLLVSNFRSHAARLGLL